MTITFKPLDESHFPLLLKWLETPHVKKWWDQDVKYTMDLVREKYSSYVKGYKLTNETQKPIQGFIIHNNQNPVGYIQIYNVYDFPRSKPLSGLPESLGAFDIFIGEEAALQQGLGSKAILEFLKLYGNQYSHIFAYPDSSNIAAIKCYEKAGFKKISEQKDTREMWMIKRIKKVRLSDYDLDTIISLFQKYFLPEDKLWIFGSRADISKKGGDIDLYIETNTKTIEEAINMKSGFLWDLEQKIGEQKIDIVLNVLNNAYPLPIHEIARTKGVRIA